MEDLRVVVRVTQDAGNKLQDMVIFANCEPKEYFAQSTDPYLNNSPIKPGEINGTKIAFASKWYNIVTREMWFYNEVNDTGECGWYDENGGLNG